MRQRAAEKDAGKEEAEPKAVPRPSKEGGELSPLITREPQGVNAVGDEEWVDIDVAIDSGPTETVMAETDPRRGHRHHGKGRR